MAIHDDNWTAEMNAVFTHTRNERIGAGILAIGCIVFLAAIFMPSILIKLVPVMMVLSVTFLAVLAGNFLWVALTGKHGLF